MAYFSTSFITVLDLEGGYQDDKNDRGNWVCSNLKGVEGKAGNYYCKNGSDPKLVGTNMGISAPVLAKHIGKVPTATNMKNLSVEDVHNIYEVKYWMRIKGSFINSQEVAHLLFDTAVNMGTTTAIRMVQKVVNELGSDVEVDGLMGSITLNSINRLPADQVHNLLKQKRIERYHAIVASNPGKEKFLNGWLNRVNSFDDLMPNDENDNKKVASITPSETIGIALTDVSLAANEFLVANTSWNYSPSNVYLIKNITKVSIIVVLITLVFFLFSIGTSKKNE